jgi:glycosyltransferase involved in cell wall biosynthesis
MNITVVTARFTLSGVPLAQIRLAEALSRRGHNVRIIFCYADPSYTLPSLGAISVVVWNIRNMRAALWALARELYIRNPDIIFAAEDHLNIAVSIAALLVGSKVKISASSRVTPFDTYSDFPFSKRWFLKQLSRFTFHRVNLLTCVSTGMVEQYRQVFPRAPHICVYNPVVNSYSLERMHDEVAHDWFVEKSGPVLVAAGQLAPWKGFEYLIKSLVLLPAWRSVRLLILGDGPLRDELEELIYLCGLRHCVDLVGCVENPLKYFYRSDVFVLSSLVEGMPNVLVEAMMCGCTPVATDCPTGPRELLQGGRFGYLVPTCNPEAMAVAIERALDSPIPRNLLDEAIAPFEEGRVIDRHFELLGLCHPPSI